MTERTVDIKSCARCGDNHDRMIFYEFGKPIVDTDGTIWDWWGLCPKTGDPVLLRSEKADLEDDALEAKPE